MSTLELRSLIEKNSTAVLQEMLKDIGHMDETIRDHQNLRLFLEIMQYNLLSTVDKQYLVSKLTKSSYFYYQIGEKGTDSVFQRSLSAMWLSYLVESDAQQPFLTKDQYDHIVQLSTSYLSKEKDTRGYVDGKGWAYAIANGADLLLALIQHPNFEVHQAVPVLQSIRDCFWKETVYVDDEEERLIRIIQALIRKNIDEKVLIEWVEQVFDSLEYTKRGSGYSRLFLKARTETLDFMKSFYFSLKFRQVMPELQGVVSHFIGKWS